MLNFVEKVMALWGPIPGLDDDPADFPHFDAPDPLPRQDDDDPEDRVVMLAGGVDGTVMAGALSLIGLGPVRSALGEKWPALSAEIVRIRDEVLTRMLPPPDFFVQHDSDNVLVCFVSPDFELAEHRTAMMARALQDELEQQLGDLRGRISVEHVASKIALRDARVGRSELVQGLLRRLEEMREDARRRGRTTSAWVRGTRMLFQPLWDVDKERTGPNRCLLDIAGAGTTLSRLETISGSESAAQAVARLDFLTFARAVEVLRAGPHDYRQSPLMLPVHHATLRRAAWRADYLKMCMMVPEADRDFIQLEILGVPEDATASELAGHVQELAACGFPVVLQISLRTPQPSVPPEGGLLGGLFGLSFNFGELGRLQHLQGPLRALARLAHARGLASYAVGANTIGQAQAAREAGFNFIGGAAIHATVDEPKTAARFVPLPHRQATHWPANLPTGSRDQT